MSNFALTWAWRQAVEPSGAKFVLVALADFADEAGICWPSQATLASNTGQSERTVRGHVRLLEDGGWIVREQGQLPNGRYASDIYRLLAPPEALRGGNDPRGNRGPKRRSGAAVSQNKPAADIAAGESQHQRQDLPPDQRQISTAPAADSGNALREPPDEPSQVNRPAVDGGPAFACFWDAYPHPAGDPPAPALAAFEAALAQGVSDAVLIEAAVMYAAQLRAQASADWKPQAKMAHRWLGEKRWQGIVPRTVVAVADAPVIAEGVDADLAEAWIAARAALRQADAATFNSWIRALVLAPGSGEAAVLQAPSLFHRDWLRQNMGGRLSQALGGRPVLIVTLEGGAHG